MGKGRVLFVITGLALGGAETQVVHLARRLKQRNWDILVVTLLKPGPLAAELQEGGITVESLGMSSPLSLVPAMARLTRLIRSWKPQILHAHMVHANILARLVRPLARVPVLICTAHNIDERGRKGSGRLRVLLYRWTDLLCDLTTQVSQAGLERYVRIRAVPPHKIRYIPNGVDTERFRPNPELRGRLREEMELGEAFVWLAVGRFGPQKDYPTMLRAFASVVHKHPETLLLIAGDGPLRPLMEKLAEDLHISARTKFLGIRRDIPELMNAADAYVMSSAWEGMPNVLLEAHASGLPVVATDVGGNREVVIDGVTGFLVPPKDPEALAQAMLRLIELPEEKCQRMEEAARQHILANFSLERVVDQWEALYRELLAKKKGLCYEDCHHW